MPQSFQDDHFESLQTFAEATFLTFVLANMKRPLTTEEEHVLLRATEVTQCH